MKTCPACKTQYSDDSLSYCLQDGTPLSASQSETPTVVIPEVETSVRKAGSRINVDLADPQTTSWQSQATHVTPATAEKKGTNVVLAVGVTAVVLILLFGIIGFAAFMFLRNSQIAGLQNGQPSINSGGPTSNVTSNSTPGVTTTPAKTPSTTSSTPRSTPQSPPESTPLSPPPPRLSSYPATKRLVFAKGAYSTSFSGDVNPGDSRSLVLGCRAGQSLSASVSGDSCVTIRGGGSSLSYITRAGDNYITLSNNCSTVARFNISIRVV